MSDDHLIDYDRIGSITASVVGAILRMDPSSSRKRAWRIITGREPFRTGPDIERGHAHEADAIAGLECEQGLLCDPIGYVSHPDFEWLGASPDAIVDDGDVHVPVEAKCPRSVHTVVPAHYNAQLQTQMQCLGAPYGWFVSWTDSAIWYTKVGRDDQWWEDNFPLIQEFYELYVKPDVEPPRSPSRRKKGSE